MPVRVFGIKDADGSLNGNCDEAPSLRARRRLRIPSQTVVRRWRLRGAVRAFFAVSKEACAACIKTAWRCCDIQ